MKKNSINYARKIFLVFFQDFMQGVIWKNVFPGEVQLLQLTFMLGADLRTGIILRVEVHKLLC